CPLRGWRSRRGSLRGAWSFHRPACCLPADRQRKRQASGGLRAVPPATDGQRGLKSGDGGANDVGGRVQARGSFLETAGDNGKLLLQHTGSPLSRGWPHYFMGELFCGRLPLRPAAIPAGIVAHHDPLLRWCAAATTGKSRLSRQNNV